MLETNILLLFALVLSWSVSVVGGQCVEMERLDWGWELIPGDTLRRQARGLEGCQRLCVYWTPCRASSFHPSSHLCLLSPYPPSPLPSIPEGRETHIVSILRNSTCCQGASAGPCSSRPCDVTETCAPVHNAAGHLCLSSLPESVPATLTSASFSTTDDSSAPDRDLRTAADASHTTGISSAGSTETSAIASLSTDANVADTTAGIPEQQSGSSAGLDSTTVTSPVTAQGTGVEPGVTSSSTHSDTTSAATALTIVPVASCPFGTFFLGTSSRYCVATSILHNATFDEAVVFCARSNLHLLTAETALKMGFIRTVYSGHENRLWLYAQSNSTDDWTWLHSQAPVTYFDWNFGEPNGGRELNCLVLNNKANFMWHDIACTSRYDAVCEVDLLE